MNDLPALRLALLDLRGALQHTSLSLVSANRLRERLIGRIERDLLPRLVGETPVLIVAVAGPNNVGKSSLFNSLSGTTLSPALAEGGLTKQCLAVAHPAALSEPVEKLLEQRYDVVRISAQESPPVNQPGPAGRLYLASSSAMAPGLLLMDTPDFDSVYGQNRANAEALLLTADVVVFVVSRQTYQNAALVGFLGEVVRAGRPYVLLYNEAANPETARAHLKKLEQDVGQKPMARFFALHQPGVERGEPLVTRSLDSSVSPDLGQYLANSDSAEVLKRKALEAGLREAREGLTALTAALQLDAAGPQRVLTRLRHELLSAGKRTAQRSVPADVLITALRDELDARSRFHRWVRLPFRVLATTISAVGRRAREVLIGNSGTPSNQPEVLAEATLRDGLRGVLEALAAEASNPELDAPLRATLEAACGAEQRTRIEAPLELVALRQPESDRAALEEFCRKLVREELPGGAEEGALQALATLVYSVPASTAAAVTVAAGGVGTDVVVWAGTLLTTPLMERFVDLLGAHIRENVQRRWCDAHGATLARGMEETLFAELSGVLQARLEENDRAVTALATAGQKL